jgi:SNF family Na+-dependent transporter
MYFDELFIILRASHLQKFPMLSAGIGYGGQVVLLYSCITYPVILTWALFYLIFSFSYELPWASCTNYWNTGISNTPYNSPYVQSSFHLGGMGQDTGPNLVFALGVVFMKHHAII